MRHRIGMAGCTGLGNPNPCILDNKGTLNTIQTEVADEFIKIYNEGWGCDYGIGENYFMLGIEPSYMGDDLTILLLHKNKNNSSLQTGRAFGYYGSGIRSRTKYYKEYKYNSKFKKFVDKFHSKLFSKRLK